MNSNIVVSFHHALEMKHHLEADEIERQLQCKRVTEGKPIAHEYIHEEGDKKSMYIEFYCI